MLAIVVGYEQVRRCIDLTFPSASEEITARETARRSIGRIIISRGTSFAYLVDMPAR